MMRCSSRGQAAHLEDLAHANSDGGLAGARGTGEAHVERWHGGLKAELAAHLVEHKKGGDLAHAFLYWEQTDKVVVELLKDLGDAALVPDMFRVGRVQGGAGSSAGWAGMRCGGVV